jgi:trimethylamine--corrinoid protein Co-methyltransferase
MPHPGKTGFKNFYILSEAQCQEIHLASLDILERTGIQILDDEAVRILKDAGAYVSKDNVAHFPAHLVAWALKVAPPRVVLYDRLGRQSMFLEGRNVYFGTGSDCPNILDSFSGERRPFLKEDVENGIRLCDALEHIDFVLSIGLISDVPVPVSDIHQFEAMFLNTTKPVVFTAHGVEGCRYIVEMAEVPNGRRMPLHLRNNIAIFVETNPPLRFSKETLQKVLYMAERKLPIVFSSGALMGASGPQTLAGILALSNAENLAGNVIVQLKNHGSPFIYALGIHPLDMQTTILPYGAPELSLSTAAAADLAHFYGLPVWGYAGCSDAKTVDQQAAIEATTSITMSILTGNNLIHDVGYIESGKTSSYEMIVLSDTVISMVRAMLKPIQINHETLALDLIHKVGQGGSFLSEKHTLNHFREVWYSKLVDRKYYDGWLDDGCPTMGDRLNQRVRKILDSHQSHQLSEQVVKKIREIVRRAEDDLVK